MDRKIVFGCGAVALALGVSVGTGSGFADAAPVPVPFSGAMTCSLAGSYIFSPGLDNAGSAQSTVTVKAKLTSCHGVGATNGTASIVSGHLVATSATTIANSWGGVTGGEALPALTGTIAWQVSGGHATETNVTLTSQAISYNTGTNVISLFVTPVLSGGSYSGQATTTSGLTANVAGVTLSAKAGKNSVKMIAFGTNGGKITMGAGA